MLIVQLVSPLKAGAVQPENRAKRANTTSREETGGDVKLHTFVSMEEKRVDGAKDEWSEVSQCLRNTYTQGTLTSGELEGREEVMPEVWVKVGESFFVGAHHCRYFNTSPK